MTRLAGALTPALVAAAEPAGLAPTTRADVAISKIITSGQSERVVWLKICAHTHEAIGRAVGVSADCVDRYVKSSHYAALYEQRKAEFLGRVLEEMQARFLEVGLEALEVRKDLMRNASNKWLRDKIAKDLIELALEVGKARGPRGDVADKLIAAVERIRKRKLSDGTVETERIRVTGRAGEAAETLAAQVAAGLDRADDQGAGGEGAGAVVGPDQARGADGPAEAA